MKKIKNIFFDLDHTIWDFEKNSSFTFKKIFKNYQIDVEHDKFLDIYVPINFKFWKLYREEKISKEFLRYNRLKSAFDKLSIKISDKTINNISDDYWIHRTRKNFKDRTPSAQGEDTFEFLAKRAIFIIDRVVIEEIKGGVDLKAYNALNNKHNFNDKNPYGGSNKTGVRYGFNTDCNDTWKLGRTTIYGHHTKNELKLYTCTKLNDPIIINTITIY